MKNLMERAFQAASRYLTLKGYEMLDDSWEDPVTGDQVGVVADDDGDIVFATVSARTGVDGFGKEAKDRGRLESLAAKWLASHQEDDLVDRRVRFDDISMLVVSENRALLRHHVNTLIVDSAA